MKAWRSRAAQQSFAAGLEPAQRARLPQRLGRLARDHHSRIVGVPSFLIQRLMIRAGLMRGD